MSNLRLPQNFQSPYDVTSLITHNQGVTTTLAACFYALSAVDGTVVAMTSFSSDLTGVPGYPGVTFKRNTGVTASQLQSNAGNAFSQMEASVFLIAAGISEADILAGKWRKALGILFVCNYEALNMGQLIMQYGYLAEFVQRSPVVTCEIKGLNNALTAQMGTVTRAECSHDFLDAGCAGTLLDSADYQVGGTVTSATSSTVFSDSGQMAPASWFNNGFVVFSSGNNTNYVLRVDSYDFATGTFHLRTPAPYLPVIGDNFNATAGCQKRQVDCQTRMENDFVTIQNNIANFSGFSFIPSIESMARLPGGLGV